VTAINMRLTNGENIVCVTMYCGWIQIHIWIGNHKRVCICSVLEKSLQIHLTNFHLETVIKEIDIKNSDIVSFVMLSYIG